MTRLPQLSVLSYNIHKGFRTGGKQFVLPDIRRLLQETAVDIVFLQEVVLIALRGCVTRASSAFPAAGINQLLASKPL